MSIISKIGALFGGGLNEIATGVADVVDHFVETKEEKEAAAVLRLSIEQNPMKWQNEINKISAGHRSAFVAWWRPFVGWVLGISLAMYYIPQFALASIIWWKLSWASSTLVAYPIASISGLTELLVAILGLAGFRSFEKKTGVSR